MVQTKQVGCQRLFKACIGTVGARIGREQWVQGGAASG